MKSTEARATANLALVLVKQRRFDMAMDQYNTALRLMRELGESDKEVRILGRATECCIEVGRYTAALELAARHAALVAGNPAAVATVGSTIGRIKRLMNEARGK